MTIAQAVDFLKELYKTHPYTGQMLRNILKCSEELLKKHPELHPRVFAIARNMLNGAIDKPGWPAFVRILTERMAANANKGGTAPPLVLTAM